MEDANTLYHVHRYEEAREEEKLRNQKEDFSDMVAEVHSSHCHQLRSMSFLLFLFLGGVSLCR